MAGMERTKEKWLKIKWEKQTGAGWVFSREMGLI